MPDASSPVRWTKALRAKLEPFPSAEASAPLPMDRCLELLRSVYATQADRLAQGRDEARGHFRDVMDALEEASTGPVGKLDVDVEAARATLVASFIVRDVNGVMDGLFDLWLELEGLPFAVSAVARALSMDFAVDSRTAQQVWLRSLERASHAAGSHRRHLWRGLRRRICRARAEEYARARAAATKLRENASADLSVSLAYAFPSEPEWAHDDVRSGTFVDSSRAEWLLASARDRDLVIEVLERGRDFRRYWLHAAQVHPCNFLHTLGVDAIGPLAWIYDLAQDDASHRGILEILGCLETPAAATFLAERVAEKYVGAVADEHFSRRPRLAIAALARAAATRPDDRSIASVFRARVLRQTELARDVARELEPPEREAVDAVLTEESIVEAAPDELPHVLTEPPWDRSDRPEQRIVEGLAPLPCADRFVWDGEDQALWATRRPYHLREWERSEENDRVILKQLQERRNQAAPWFTLWELQRLTDAAAIELWNELPEAAIGYAPDDELRSVLARFELDCVPGMLTAGTNHRQSITKLLRTVATSDVATFMMESLSHSQTTRRLANEWLLRFSEEATIYWIPTAVGAPGPARTRAERALVALAGQGRGDVILHIASRYGAPVERAVRDILAGALFALPKKLPRLPSFWSPRALPRPLLRDSGHAIPLSSVETLSLMLAFSPLEAPYAGLEPIKAACEPASLGRFAWELFTSWQLAGAPSKESWAFHALGHLGSDSEARQLAPLLKQWPSDGQHKRAVNGLDVLARIGTDVALMHLYGISQKVKSRSLQNHAAAKMEQVADGLGLTAEELADRLVPELGLDRDGSRVLDYGPRHFRVGFDEHLKPYVLDENGKQRASLPKAAQSDDPDKAKLAASLWKGIKKEARVVAANQIARLETAMCDRRRWRLDDFQRYLVEHPLMIHLVKRLVWASYDGHRLDEQTFRVAEDGTFANAEDRTHTVSPDAEVGLPHRIELPQALADAWLRCFGDYLILQPFDQLNRPVFTREDRPFETLPGTTVATSDVLGLERRRWRRGDREGRGIIRTMVKPIADAPYEAVLAIDPGMYSGAIDVNETQTLRELHVQRGGTGDVAPRLPPDELDAIDFSELAADIRSLTQSS